ncbi:AslB [Citrus sinensis]|uniref:AslB n=1 Tax=Citrus sinensis TaxID=2711 RepID=A0ACB8NP10_CITSI|nr:AslB [Citrus sinensis]
MEKTVYLFLLFGAISTLCNGVEVNAKARKTLPEIDRKLKLLNRPAVKSIKSEDGDIIDCVDIYKQPALDHPALKNHTIQIFTSLASYNMQLSPSFDIPAEKVDRRNESSRLPVTIQTWQKSGSCPNGTVPIRRIRRQDLLRASSLQQFGRKVPEVSYAANRTDATHSKFESINNKTIHLGPLVDRSAAVLVTVGFNYIGAQGDINVWNPRVESPDDYTTAQIWLKGGPGDNFESVEGGWVVNPKLYGDKLTRLFVYWTKDSYKSTGCFDAICSGFVQTGQVALGAAIGPWSISEGPQYYLPVGIYLDPNTKNWWLKVNGNIVVGYWPGSLFSYLSYSAILVEWGGQVYSPNVKKTPHTKTAMGSGSFSHGLQGSACSIEHVRIIDFSLQLKYPQWVGTWADEYYCYDAYNYVKGYTTEPVFFFGGPGQNPIYNMLAMEIYSLSNGVKVNAKARETLSEIDKKLKLINKPAVKSIKSEDGDIIDCVDIYKQPAFDYPALKNHTIQLRPSFNIPSGKLDRRNESFRPVAVQTWQKSGSCPNGTVPIRRIRRQDLLTAASLEQFGRKFPEISYAANKTDAKHSKFVSLNSKTVNLDRLVNRSAAVLLTVGYNYIGAQANINVWCPNVESTEDYTTAQIWLKGGPGDNFESVESGWMINPKLYGDKLPRFFAYWTRDAYKSTGCFDLTCTGFVQTGTQIALGASISPWSSTAGPQYYIPIAMSRDPQTGNWWLMYGDAVIGYWPGALFDYLKQSAIFVEWGGQVYSPNVKKTPHTKTAMGSGSFASSLYGSACYIDHIRIIDYSLQLKYPQWVGTWADEEDCYDAYNLIQGYTVEPVFFFGGPGQNPHCICDKPTTYEGSQFCGLGYVATVVPCHNCNSLDPLGSTVATLIQVDPMAGCNCGTVLQLQHSRTPVLSVEKLSSPSLMERSIPLPRNNLKHKNIFILYRLPVSF